jgi:periplasmic copper chaperone A
MTFLRTTLVVLLLNLPIHAQPNPTASDAWAQVSGSAVAVYATVNNPSMYDIYLVSGKSDAAAKIELLDGDKPVTSITVPAYGSAELKPGAMFVRLSELKGELKAGDEVKLTLETDGGISIELAAVIK